MFSILLYFWGLILYTWVRDSLEDKRKCWSLRNLVKWVPWISFIFDIAIVIGIGVSMSFILYYDKLPDVAVRQEAIRDWNVITGFVQFIHCITVAIMASTSCRMVLQVRSQ